MNGPFPSNLSSTLFVGKPDRTVAIFPLLDSLRSEGMGVNVAYCIRSPGIAHNLPSAYRGSRPGEQKNTPTFFASGESSPGQNESLPYQNVPPAKKGFQTPFPPPG